MPELPFLSPDNKEIAYTWEDDAEIDGGAQLRIVANEAGARPRVLVRSRDLDIYSAGWSPDGKSILAAVLKNGAKEVGWVSVADGTVKVLKSHSPRQSKLSLSPDGRYIAYYSWVTEPTRLIPNPETHIFIVSADGSSDVEVIKTAGVNRDPVWTPDGKHLLFVSDRSGTLDLWSVAVKDGKNAASPTLVRKEVGEIHPISITRSGTLYFTRERVGVDDVAVENISIAEWTSGGGSHVVDNFVGFSPSWSRDGKSIEFQRHSKAGGKSDLLVRSNETADEKVCLHDADLQASPAEWFHDGSGLLYKLRGEHNATLWFLDRKTRESKMVLLSGRGISGPFALSKDDQTAYSFIADATTGAFDRIAAFDLTTGQPKTVLMLPGTSETLPRSGGIGIALSPDGQTLAFTTINFKTRDAHLALVRVDGSEYHEIYGPFHALAVNRGLAWTKDGRKIVFATSADDGSENWRIMRIAIDGGKPEFTGLAISGMTVFVLSPDDSRIAFGTPGKSGSRISELFAIYNLPALLKD
jgi:Tol biopolymer transport system component